MFKASNNIFVWLYISFVIAFVVQCQKPNDSNGVSSPEGMITFVSDRTGEASIYVMNADGSSPQLLASPDKERCHSPSWSPDGSKIAYQSVSSPEPHVYENDVWVMGVDGSEGIRINDIIPDPLMGAYDIPVWSPDGIRLALKAASDAEIEEQRNTIYIVSADGSTIQKSIHLPWTAGGIIWSPVNEELLITTRLSSMEWKIFKLSLITEELTEIYTGALAKNWSPDGSEIVIGTRETQEILIADAGQNIRGIARLENKFPIEVVWSPDGEGIVVSTSPSIDIFHPTDLYIISVETGEVTTVTQDEYQIFTPNWSPDGRYLLYTTTRGGRDSELPYATLWIYNIESGEITKLTPGTRLDSGGVWSPVLH